jgi:prophage antirepressor-like protein
MNKKISKFLEFNGKTLYFLSKNGEYWVALKPICEAIGVNWARQHTNLITDPIFGQLYAEQHMVGADGKNRKMVSLPEKWVYGWLMGIQSASPDLLEYKKHCYEVLNAYFHGTITNRKELLAQKARAKKEIDEIMNSLETDQALKLDRNQRLVNQINAELRKLDNEVIEEEYDLFSTQ